MSKHSDPPARAPRHRIPEQGLIVIVMYQGRYRATHRKGDNNALLQHLAQMDRGGHEWAFEAHRNAAR